jgi:hypothetical protein
MQAIDQRSGGSIDLFKATEQNLSCVFEGITSGLDVSCKNLAKGLVTKGILVSNPIGNNRYVFAAAVLAGDQTKIDNYKKDIRQNGTTLTLVTDGGLDTALPLSPALRLRFECESNTGKITPITIADYTRTINILRDKPVGWKFHAVIAFAKDDAEAASFRNQLKTVIADKQYENIVFIDALSTPLGLEAFEQYVDDSAMAMYNNMSNNTASRQNSDKARRILDQDWKTRIYNGQFIIYTYANQEGEKLGNGQGVSSVLQTIVVQRFSDTLTFDFAKGLSENQLKLTNGKASAKSGISQNTSGVVVGLEKHILPSVWKVDKYWESHLQLPISKIKIAVEKLIEDAFGKGGQISIDDIYDYLEKTFGFAPCNLSAFLVGFLLKEYGGEPFRYSDSSGGHESMTQEKLAEMIGNYIGKSPKPTYIVKMTAEEKAFYELTEKAWNIAPNSCSSAGQAAVAVAAKMRAFGLPVWSLAEVDTNGIFDIVQKYIKLVQKEGAEAHQKAVEIGKIAVIKTTLPDNLAALLTVPNCQKGMREFLSSFEEGKIQSLANEIGAGDDMLSDIRTLFEIKHSCLWDRPTGEDEIRKLLTEYGIVKEINAILNTTSHSKSEAFKSWHECLKNIGISHEALNAKFPLLANALGLLLKICKQEDISSDQLKSFFAELTTHGAEVRDMLNNDKRIFSEIYEPYLEGFSDADITEIKSKLTMGMFELPKTDCNTKVKTAAEEFRKGQLKTKLRSLWKDKTRTKDPNDWSYHYKMPILCLINGPEFETARKAFDTLNRSSPSDIEIKAALDFLETTTLFDVLSDETKRNESFERELMGEYRSLVTREQVLNALDLLSIDTYNWYANPDVKTTIRNLAEAEYNAGGSDKALTKIDGMSDAQLKQYLKRLVKENMTVGIEIIMNGGE